MKWIEEKFININWMRKELYEMLFDGEIDERVLKVFTGLIGKWIKEREKNDRD